MDSKYKLWICQQHCIHPRQPSRWTCAEDIQFQFHEHQEKLPKAHLKTRLDLRYILKIQEKKCFTLTNQHSELLHRYLKKNLFINQKASASKELELILDSQQKYSTNIFQLEQILAILQTIADYHQFDYEKFPQLFAQDYTDFQAQDHLNLLNIVQEIYDQTQILIDSCKSSSQSYLGEFCMYFDDQRNEFKIDKKIQRITFNKSFQNIYKKHNFKQRSNKKTLRKVKKQITQLLILKF